MNVARLLSVTRLGVDLVENTSGCLCAADLPGAFPGSEATEYRFATEAVYRLHQVTARPSKKKWKASQSPATRRMD